MSESGDKELLDAARAGDTQALEALLLRHEREIFRYGMRMCRDPEDAGDIAQETLLSAARSIRDFRGASSVSTWLYAIARSHCIRKRRRSKFAPLREESLDSGASAEVEAVVDPAPPADEIVGNAEIRGLIERAIGELEPGYRDVLILRDVEGFTAPEVAEILGISAEAVKSRLHRARLHVRSRVAPALGQPAALAPAVGDRCADVLTLFSRHLEGEIRGEICREMEEHLAGCSRCRGACDSLRRTLSLCREAEAAPVPEPVQHRVRVALRKFLSAGATGAR